MEQKTMNLNHMANERTNYDSSYAQAIDFYIRTMGHHSSLRTYSYTDYLLKAIYEYSQEVLKSQTIISIPIPYNYRNEHTKNIKEEKIESIFSFLKEKDVFLIENKRNLELTLKSLLSKEIEEFYHFLQELTNYLQEEKLKAELSSEHDRIFIFIIFNEKESSERVEEVLDRVYDLLLRNKHLTFISIGEEFRD